MNKDTSSFRGILLIASTLFLAHALSTHVRAAGTVTNATEADLRAALAGGGLVTIACDGTITLANALWLTNAATVIDGTGHSIMISGNHAVQVFVLDHFALSITNVTIANGNAGAFDVGGAVKNNYNAPLTFINCTFAGNTATWGGAIFGYGNLDARGCTFVSNSASIGGAVALPGGNNTLVASFTNCTFYGQTGSAINRSPFAGSSGGPTVKIVNCTFATNSGPALDNSNNVGFYIDNSVASGNGGQNFNDATLIDGGYNLSSDASGNLTNLFSLQNIDPRLGSLTNNGGPTLTMMPAPDSPAIDGGNNGTPTDQRGVARPAGTFSDIGAVESIVPGTHPGIFSLVVTNLSTVESNTSLTFSVVRAGGLAGPVSVTFVTSNGTAIAGEDFVATNGTLIFAAGQRSNTLSVSLLDDSVLEGLETFSVNLTGATGGAAINRQTVSVSIADNDTETGARFSVTNFNVTESVGTATITVSRTSSTNLPMSVDYIVSDGTAQAGSDYVMTNGTVNFSAGQTSASFTVAIINDSLLEPDETVNLALSNAVGGVLVSPATATVTLLNDDSAMYFSATNFTVNEFAGAATVTVLRVGATAWPVSVNYTTSDGTAQAGSDYIMTNGTVNFSAGQTNASFTIPIIDDGVIESDEIVNLSLSNPVGGVLTNPSTATLTILGDNEVGLRFSSATFNANESAGMATITVSRVGDTAPAVSVNYATSAGTAQAGSDYINTNGTLNFSSGQTNASFTVTIIDDSLIEPDETVNLSLSNAVGGSLLNPSAATLKILNDDVGVRFSAASFTVNEPTGAVTITVFRTGNTNPPLSVDYITSDGTAQAGTDYVATNGTLNFSSGQILASFTVTIINDSLIEPDKTLNLALSNAVGGFLVSPATATLTIINDDIGVCFTATNFTVTESVGTATVTVSRLGYAAPPVAVGYATSDGSAQAGSDYQGVSGTVNFSSGQTTASFNIPIYPDTIVEPDETVALTLSNPTAGVLVNPASATLTIANDDATAPGQLQFDNAAYSVTEGTGQALISVVRTGGDNVPVTVNYATSNGTAVAGQDYTSASGTLTFNPGETVKFFSVPILANAPVEGNETVSLALSSPTGGAALGVPVSAVLTISDGGQTVGSCDETSLRAAVSVGGHVVLPCDGTIVLTSPLIISNAVFVDGSGHTPVLSGSNATRLFVVNPGVTLALRGVTVADGLATNSLGNPGVGGAILNNGGQVLLADCSLLQNVAVGGISGGQFGPGAGEGLGGALYSSNGFVWATNTVFKANQAKGGQGITSGRSGNAYGGALYQSGGESLLWNCRFESNTASSPFPIISFPPFASGGQTAGGGIWHSNGVLTVTGCEFLANAAVGGSAYRVGIPYAGQGGAIFSASELTVNDCSFRQNSALAGKNGTQGANGEGGALYLATSASVSTSLFQADFARGGEGYTGGLSPLPGGVGRGGSIYNLATLTLVDSTLAGNESRGADGYAWSGAVPGTAGLGGALFTSGVLLVTNVTFAGNRAAGGAFPKIDYPTNSIHSGGNGLGGGLYNLGGTVVLVHTTLASNSAAGGQGSPYGLSQGGAILNTNGTITVIGSIVANSPSGGNAFGVLTDGGYNLSSDATCAFSAPGSLNNTDPVLGPLLDYGGPTPTMALLAGSPAIDAAGNPGNPPADQRGRSRPFGPANDIGAFESSPPYSIHGRVSGRTLTDEVPMLADVYSTTTFDGNYDLNELPVNTYSVTPSDTNYVFIPANIPVTVGPDKVGVDFKAYHVNVLSLDDVTNQTMHIIVAGANGQTYRLLASSNLLEWTPVLTNIMGSESYWELFLPIDDARAKFYRTVTP